MNRHLASVTVAATALSLAAGLAAQARGTPAEAQAMLRRAVQHYDSVGRTRALKDFMSRQAPFFDRDLYVACIGPDHKLSANGAFPAYVGTSTDLWRDADGKPLGAALVAAAAPGGAGSVRYRWTNPLTRQVESKVSYVRKVGDDVCVVGAYSQ
jgi:hypothetical protein